jgi:DNA-binding GntR family transcriptional regulator
MIRRAKTLAQQAADAIRRRIVGGELPMGAPLSENALAAELGVSKTPVREALLQLKMEGLVSIYPQRGSFVFDMTQVQIVELGELREALELAALALAMQRNRRTLVAAWRDLLAAMQAAIEAGDDAGYRELDAKFHDVMLRLCGNGLMYEHYCSFALRVNALRHWLSVRPGMNEASLIEHQAICDHVARNDLEGARISLAAHMQGTIWNFNAVQSGDAA